MAIKKQSDYYSALKKIIPQSDAERQNIKLALREELNKNAEQKKLSGRRYNLRFTPVIRIQKILQRTNKYSKKRLKQQLNPGKKEYPLPEPIINPKRMTLCEVKTRFFGRGGSP